MTIKQARKVLGRLANKLSDKELEKELQVAIFLAEIYSKEYPRVVGKDTIN